MQEAAAEQRFSKAYRLFLDRFSAMRAFAFGVRCPYPPDECDQFRAEYFPEEQAAREQILQAHGLSETGKPRTVTLEDGSRFKWPNEHWSSRIRCARYLMRDWEAISQDAIRAVHAITSASPHDSEEDRRYWCRAWLSEIHELIGYVPSFHEGFWEPPYVNGDQLIVDDFGLYMIDGDLAGRVHTVLRGRLPQMMATESIIALEGVAASQMSAANDPPAGRSPSVGSDDNTVWLDASVVAALLDLKTQTVAQAARLEKIVAEKRGGANSSWIIDAESAAKHWKAKAGPLRERIAAERKQGR